MKFSNLILALGASAALCSAARAQILVNLPGGSATYDFSSTPSPTEWATTNGLNTAGGAGVYTDLAQLTAGIQALAHTFVGTNLPATAANATFAYARHNTAGGYLVTQPTTVAAALIKATLRNNTGGQVHSLDVLYDFGVRNTPANESAGLTGHQVFFSTNGQPNSWNFVPSLSGLSAAAAGVTATLFLDAWEPGTDIYLLWADDNASVANSTDGAYSIDNFRISNVVSTNAETPLSIILSSPLDGEWLLAPADVIASVVYAGTFAPFSANFYTNGVLFATTFSLPFMAALDDLPAGTYDIYADASNGFDPLAVSATHRITVRPDLEFAEYTGGTLTEDFNSMTTNGTLTPIGWYVGAALPAVSLAVTPDHGLLAPSGILGLNYGSLGAADRSLGTAPTGGDRNTVLRLRNSSGSNIVSFVVKYDGETWRSHASATTNEYLTNYVSFDLGGTWIPTGANYINPIPGQNPPAVLDGNAVANRVADITTSIISPPVPIAPGEVIYIRWQNFNEGGTDGGMAIDNFSFTATALGEAALNVIITSPTNGQSFSGGCPGAADLTVNASSTTIPGETVVNVSFQVDGGAPVDDASPPFSVVLPGVAVGPHVITAITTDTTGNTATNSVNISVTANAPPAVAITNYYCFTTNSAAYFVGSSITNDLAMSDNTGITNVTFLVNDTVQLVRAAATGRIVVNDVLAGVNTFRAVVTDTCGLSTTSAPVIINVTNPPAVTFLVTNGSLWKYDNTSNDLGTAWIDLFHDDSLWPAGQGDLGEHGAADNTTVRTQIDIGAGVRIPTIYFRHTFHLTSLDGLGDLVLNVLRDDGVAVYLNGTRILTNNLPGTFTWATFANPQAPDDGRTYLVTNIGPGNLVIGDNILAAEVHNVNTTSSDLIFDLMLWALPPAGPTLTITHDAGAGTATITWAPPGGTLEYTDALVSPPAAILWTPIPGAVSGHTVPAGPPASRFYRVTVP